MRSSSPEISASALDPERKKLLLLMEQVHAIDEQLTKSKALSQEARQNLTGKRDEVGAQLINAQPAPAGKNPFAFGTIANRNFESDQGGFGTIAGRDAETKDPSAWGSLAHSDAMLGLIPLPKDKSDQEKPITEKEMHNVLDTVMQKYWSG